MTSENMPKEVFIEDVIDRIAQLTKYQLTNTIYPEFDPVYRVTPDEKSKCCGFLLCICKLCCCAIVVFVCCLLFMLAMYL